MLGDNQEAAESLRTISQATSNNTEGVLVNEFYLILIGVVESLVVSRRVLFFFVLKIIGPSVFVSWLLRFVSYLVCRFEACTIRLNR